LGNNIKKYPVAYAAGTLPFFFGQAEKEKEKRERRNRRKNLWGT